MKKDYKILPFNEWKESTIYYCQKWFKTIENKIKSFFEDETYQNLEFDYFEFDSSRVELAIGNLFFHEEQYQYKLSIIIDKEEITNDEDPDVLNETVIDKCVITLYMFDIDSGDELGTFNDTINTDELTRNLILIIIDKIKTDNKIDINDKTNRIEFE